VPIEPAEFAAEAARRAAGGAAEIHLHGRTPASYADLVAWATDVAGEAGCPVATPAEAGVIIARLSSSLSSARFGRTCSDRAQAESGHRMATEPKTIHVTATTELPALLDEAAKSPVILERDGERFRLSREDDIAYEPDPDLVRETLAATSGSWADLDVDRLIDEIYAARTSGSRPPDRP
jgi:hypothetical protein